MSLPRHHRDERGEAGDMQIQNVQNGEQGSHKYKGFHNGVKCTGNKKMLPANQGTIQGG